MGLLDLLTDPLGKRYKKKSMNQRLGITRIKRNLTTTFVQPFNKLNPMWHLRNAKRNVKRKLGYNSEVAKAYRSGDWGRYMKRKLLNSAPGVIMPFRESQFTPYDMQSNPFDREQTGPTNKGIFRKLAKYAAPGAIAGLALLASKKYNLMAKLRGAQPNKIEALKKHARILRDVAKAKAKSAGSAVAGGARAVKDAAATTGKAYAHSAIAAIKHYGRHAYNKVANPIKHAGKATKNKLYDFENRLKRISGKSKRKNVSASEPQLIMPFRENYGGYQQPRREPGLAEKVIAAGLMVGGAYAGIKTVKALSDVKKLAIATEKSYQKLKQTGRAVKKTTHGFAPVDQAKHAWATMKHDMLSNATSLSALFHSNKAVKAAKRAALKTRFKMYERKLRAKYPGEWGSAYTGLKKDVLARRSPKEIKRRFLDVYSQLNNKKVTPSSPTVAATPTIVSTVGAAKKPRKILLHKSIRATLPEVRANKKLFAKKITLPSRAMSMVHRVRHSKPGKRGK